MSKKGSQPTEHKYAAEPDNSIGDEIRRLAKLHCKRIVNLVDKVKEGDVEAVHDMRTANRRLRAMIRLKRDLDDSKSLKSIAKFAKSLGGHLGAVRGDDVMRNGLDELEPSDAIRTVSLAVALRRTAAAKRLSELLSSDEFQNWLTSVHVQLEVANNDDLVRDAATKLIRRGYEDVEAHSSLDADAELSEIHELRIDSKQFRYSLEFFGRATSWKTAPFLKRLVKLQDGLGALHDDELLAKELASAMRAKIGWPEGHLKDLERECQTVQFRLSDQHRQASELWRFLFSNELKARIEA